MNTSSAVFFSIEMAIFIFSIGMIIFICRILLRRNEAVAAFRHRLVHECKGYRDFAEYDALPSYTSMVYHFWRPLESYRSLLSRGSSNTASNMIVRAMK